MKSAYELAMEKLAKQSPAPKLSAEKKAKIAELNSRYEAKIANLEITIQADIATAEAASDAERVEECRQRLAAERRELQAQLESKKEEIRQSG